MSSPWDNGAEWLEADGLGGFASGTVGGVRTRRYHGLLLAAVTPPTGRFMLVNGFDAWVETSGGAFAITSQKYTPDVIHPDNGRKPVAFEHAPWPKWVLRLKDGTFIQQEIFVPHGQATCVVTWKLIEAKENVKLFVRPFLSGRDYHSMHHENGAFQFEPKTENDLLTWHPYNGVPPIHSLSNGQYTHQPQWYRNFQYNEERSRGLDFTEDLAAPGVFQFDLSNGEAFWIVSAAKDFTHATGTSAHLSVLQKLRHTEHKRRESFPTELHRSADAYFVRRGEGKTLVAGYPWFTDWGRDTLIALRGLCLSTGRWKEARDILLEWASAVSQGMLPNRFPDQGQQPEFNSVDASLWYCLVVHEFLVALKEKQLDALLSPNERVVLRQAVHEILTGYANGTRFGIRADTDGLLMAGVPGVQLTWMDAKVGDFVVTARIGKPVEIQALWLNALWTARQFSPRWNELFERGIQSFRDRFWNENAGHLYDVIDCDHIAGKLDATLRPNQIFAVGGLPFPLLDGEKARRIADSVERHLLTPLGLRSLAPQESGYKPHYSGGVFDRDTAYHQGTVWPWLMGAFVEAWLRVHGSTASTRRTATERFLKPLLDHLQHAGLGHVSEIADAETPHTPNGCPFQAWSLGELLRIQQMVDPTDTSQ